MAAISVLLDLLSQECSPSECSEVSVGHKKSAKRLARLTMFAEVFPDHRTHALVQEHVVNLKLASLDGSRQRRAVERGGRRHALG